MTVSSISAFVAASRRTVSSHEIVNQIQAVHMACAGDLPLLPLENDNGSENEDVNVQSSFSISEEDFSLEGLSSGK
ncbi:hypothetical protein FNV43_RR23955 [Rhamnella rubrinervis]|uniref:Uncharacterized protein n=1 Tax=Rhamnella rubrinervis TaxID=2594499 RepID=A0A8K0GQA3_9ROSA|nr:hypothetical protein FNV43_RR23955 [Rhamnella rubrinervis]